MADFAPTKMLIMAMSTFGAQRVCEDDAMTTMMSTVGVARTMGTVSL